MPAVLAGDGVWMHWEGQVLVNADISPPDAQGVGVCGFVGRNAACAFQAPLIRVVFEADGRHHLPLAFVREFPASHVMAARDDAGPYAFGHPGADDEVADFGFDAHQLARPHT